MYIKDIEQDIEQYRKEKDKIAKEIDKVHEHLVMLERESLKLEQILDALEDYATFKQKQFDKVIFG